MLFQVDDNSVEVLKDSNISWFAEGDIKVKVFPSKNAFPEIEINQNVFNFFNQHDRAVTNGIVTRFVGIPPQDTETIEIDDDALLINDETIDI